MTIVFVTQHELDAVADKAQEAFTGHWRHDWNGSFHLKSFYHEDAKREMQKRLKNLRCGFHFELRGRCFKLAEKLLNFPHLVGDFAAWPHQQ